MCWSDGPGGEDVATAAVAAAAFAANKIENSATPDRSPTGAGPESTLTKAKSKRHDVLTQLETGEESIKSLDRKIPITGPAQPVQKRPSFAEKLLESTEDAKGGAPTPPKPSPFIKKASLSADKQFKKVTAMTAEISSTEPLPTTKPAAPPPPNGSEINAEDWMRRELFWIKESYDNLISVIATWESRKKLKAKRKLDETQRELERKQAKASRELERKKAKASQTHRSIQSELKKQEKEASKTYQTQMERIELITAAARAQAKERQRSEELKSRDKSNTPTTTWKLLITCLCVRNRRP
ncbi:hypothetical protein ACJRO7_012393 [Eucalyptus globulus]|uniref:Remorin C-terminal domain-containing protein n=1 Tax=Eucalyptus globulus TaxID=34317 RepID=A0ABD3LNZ5_EUCGL